MFASRVAERTTHREMKGAVVFVLCQALGVLLPDT